MLRDYQGKIISLKTAAQLYSTLLLNRKATIINEDGIDEMFQLFYQIYLKGVKNKIWG